MSKKLRLVGIVLCVAAPAALLSACSANNNDPDKIAGKQLFVKNCGSCHTLARAGTKGNQGPDLDDAFAAAKSSGFGESAIRGVVAKQIQHPSTNGRLCSPKCVAMPADLVTGDDVHNIAAYVAQAAAEGGQDSGLLATAVKTAGGGKPAVAKNGVLNIPTDPTGQLAYVTKAATATAGIIDVRSLNKAPVPHDIVIAGKGNGKEISGGATSEFKANFTPGKYTFYCSVPGHRQAGMEGTLTVK